MLLQLRKQYIKRNGRDCHFSRGGTVARHQFPLTISHRQATTSDPIVPIDDA